MTSPNSREWEKEFDSKIPKKDDSLFSANCESETYDFGYKHMSDDTIHTVTDWGNIKLFIHQELQKAREEERARIEAMFKEHVPPHAMDLEDSVWLKRLLNKAFNHDKNV